MSCLIHLLNNTRIRKQRMQNHNLFLILEIFYLYFLEGVSNTLNKCILLLDFIKKVSLKE